VIDDVHRLRQRERAGDMGRGDFANAVPDHGLGPDAPRRQPLGKRHLQREYRRLGDGRLADARAVLQSRQLVEQRPSGPLREKLVAGLHGLSKQRILPQQPAPHTPPLGALSGEHECEPPTARSATRYHGVGRLAGGDRAQRAHRRVGGFGRHDQTMIEMGASQRQSSRDVGERTWTRLERVRELGTRGRQRGLARCRYRNERRPPIRRGIIDNRFRRLWRLFDNRTGVRAAETEGIDSCNPRPMPPRPRPELALHANAEAVEIDVGVGCLEVQARRDLSLPHAQSRLDQPRYTGRRLEVADIGLDRTDDAGALPRASFAEHRTNRARFDRITDRGPGPVRLDVADMAGTKAGSRAGVPQHGDLRVAAGDRDRARVAVLIDGGGPDHRVNAVTIEQRS
jgi:hypothetical protein